MKKLINKWMAITLACTLTLGLAACGSTSNTTVSTANPEEANTANTTNTDIINPETTQTSETDTVTNQNMVTYPVTITDQLGRSVTIESKPEKLVSGYYITTSLMIALGLKDQLAGVEAKAASRAIYSLSAPELIDLPNVGTAKEFNLEGCAALNPDLVILPAKLKDSIPALEELGIKVIAVKPEDQKLLFEVIDMITTACDITDRGVELKNTIEASLSALNAKINNTEKPSVYFAGNSALLSTAGASMYQNTMIENAGGINVASELTDTYWAEVSYEQVLSWNPDYIFLASDAEYTVETVLTDSALADCTAVKEQHVYKLPSTQESLDSPIPASFLGSVYMASCLHPDVVTFDDYTTEATSFYETFYGFTPEFEENEK